MIRCLDDAHFMKAGAADLLPGSCWPGDAIVAMTPAVGPISKICRPGDLETAGLAGWQGSAGQKVLAVCIPAVGPRTRELETSRLQAWPAGRDLLARKFCVLVDRLWALELENWRPRDCRPGRLAGICWPEGFSCLYTGCGP